jgi:hypothetical protein
LCNICYLTRLMTCPWCECFPRFALALRIATTNWIRGYIYQRLIAISRAFSKILFLKNFLNRAKWI